MLANSENVNLLIIFCSHVESERLLAKTYECGDGFGFKLL
jgi:hypothetical protein